MNDCFTALGWTPEGRRVRERPTIVEEERKKARWKGWEVAGGTGQKVLIKKRDGLMRLLARRDFVMMMTILDSLVFGLIHLREEILESL